MPSHNRRAWKGRNQRLERRKCGDEQGGERVADHGQREMRVYMRISMAWKVLWRGGYTRRGQSTGNGGSEKADFLGICQNV